MPLAWPIWPASTKPKPPRRGQEQLYRQAAEIHKSVLGENHPDYAQSLNILASLYHDQGDYTRAGPLYRQAAETRKTPPEVRRPTSRLGADGGASEVL